ncbi:MAG TPA: condensation domain-containing protein, partial [Pyrinomonadaceae bacterium]|nr:condensation domain-containing protein [Pyrinomonadaceae bacterium]
MSDYSAALSELSPEKRELLELMLSEEATATEPLPLSFAQQRLWFIDQLEPGSFLYNICSSVRLQGRLDAWALERCFAEIVRRHETLRTRFATVDRLPVQVIADESELKIHTIELDRLSEAERDREVQRLT